MTQGRTALGHPPSFLAVRREPTLVSHHSDHVAHSSDHSAGSDDPADLDRLFREYRATRDVSIRNRLVVAHAGLADRCARRFAHRGEPLADLQQIARIGLVKAVERFEPERDLSFATFAVPTMIGEIKRYFRDRTWAVSVPRSTKDVRSLVSSSVETLEQELERPPSPSEVSAYCGVSMSSVEAALHANSAYRTSSLDTLDRPERPAPGAEGGDQLLEIATREALARLDDRKRTIMYLRFYEDRTQREIGDRVGVGQVQVSRLIRSAMRELRAQLEPVAAAS